MPYGSCSCLWRQIDSSCGPGGSPSGRFYAPPFQCEVRRAAGSSPSNRGCQRQCRSRLWLTLTCRGMVSFPNLSLPWGCFTYSRQSDTTMTWVVSEANLTYHLFSHTIMSQLSADGLYHVLDFLPFVRSGDGAVVGIGACCWDGLQEVVEVHVPQDKSKDGALWNGGLHPKAGRDASDNCYVEALTDR